ncbi:YonK family protein [Staphylococcus pseudintermedius]|nr:YonK family protein [Staphylococcus pseudintermedius]ELJ9055092.1 YonK family protein [Staphylococcus pseudintermedius]
MAKLTNTVSFKNAIIDFENDTITEVTKDTESTFKLSEIINRFENKCVSFSIKEDTEVFGDE